MRFPHWPVFVKKNQIFSILVILVLAVLVVLVVLVALVARVVVLAAWRVLHLVSYSESTPRGFI